MILGLVSFLFVIYQSIFIPSNDTVLSFEFAHFFIFLLAVFHSFVVLSTMFISLRLSARWKKMEQVDLVSYLHLKDQYTRIRLRIHKHTSPFWRRFRWWFPNLPLLLNYGSLHEMMAFHDIRFQFIFYRNLPEHFRFSSFLRKIKAVSFIELIESHWTLYAIFLVVVLFDILRRSVSSSDASPESAANPAAEQILRAVTAVSKEQTDVVESAFIIGSSVLLALVAQLLAHKIKKIYWQLTMHPRVYYEGVEPAAVEEELAAAEIRREAERQKRRQSRNGEASEDTGNLADDESADATPSVDSPETEMLAPMNPTPLSTPLVMTGVPDPNSASPIINSALNLDTSHTSFTEMPNITTAIRSPLPGKKSVYKLPKPLVPRHQNPRADSRYEISFRHSLDISQYRNSVDHSLMNRSPDKSATSILNEDPRTNSSSLDGRPVNISAPNVQIDEISARHSLDLSRHKEPKPVPTGTSNGASIAMAAVAAARKRTYESAYGRSSLDADRTRRSLGSPRLLSSRLSSRPASTDEESRTDHYRGSLERGKTMTRASIELAAAMPHEEIVERHNHQRSVVNERDLEAGIVEDQVMPRTSPSKKAITRSRIRFVLPKHDKHPEASKDSGDVRAQNSLLRHKSLSFLNPTILRHLEEQQDAQRMQPAKYPWIVTKLIPRLGRVASPVEKLFWFGSHKFFLWVVEFILFFATVLLAAAFASLAIILLAGRKPGKWNIASFVFPPCALLFVLGRVAGIMKKYIFILHNASLVPEALAIETIHNVSRKKPVYSIDDVSDESGSENEREDQESARERRRKLGKFFRSEAAVGNMPGIDAEGASSHGSGSIPARRARKRRLALRLRRKRTQSVQFSDDGDAVPDVVPDVVPKSEIPDTSETFTLAE